MPNTTSRTALFRAQGYDALIYRSQFDEDAYNVALFNLNDAKILAGAPVKITKIEVEHLQDGNPWSLGENPRGN